MESSGTFIRHLKALSKGAVEYSTEQLKGQYCSQFYEHQIINEDAILSILR